MRLFKMSLSIQSCDFHPSWKHVILSGRSATYTWPMLPWLVCCVNWCALKSPEWRTGIPEWCRVLPGVERLGVPTKTQQVARVFSWGASCLVDLPDFWVRVKPSNMRWYISASSLGQSGVSLAPCDLNWSWFLEALKKKQTDIVTASTDLRFLFCWGLRKPPSC